MRWPAVALALLLAACVPADAPPPPLLPALAAQPAALDELRVEQGTEALALRRIDGRWWIDGAHWPVAREVLDPLLIGLADARCDEPRTAQPGQFARIGVAWPAADVVDADAAFQRPTARLTLGPEGREGRVVLGFERAQGGRFVRVEGAAASCLSFAALPLPARLSDWFDTRVLDTPADVVEGVRVEPAGGVARGWTRAADGVWRPAGAMVGLLSPADEARISAALNLRQQGLRIKAADAPAPGLRLVLQRDDGETRIDLRRDEAGTWAEVLDADPRWRGREFLLPVDVAAPLWPADVAG